MIIELLVIDRVSGIVRPVSVDATFVLVRNGAGTPTMVAAEYGLERAQAISKVGDADFNQTLRNLGVGQTNIVCDWLEMPRPPVGARLVAGPDIGVLPDDVKTRPNRT